MASEAKVWFITGVSRGLGRDLARAALDRGDTVVGTSRSGQADSTIDPGPGRLRMLALDVTVPEQAAEAVRAAEAEFGRIDVLINNAGAGLLGAVEESGAAEGARVMEVNFFGPLRLIQAALPGMRARGSGRIVNITSIAGLAPMAGSGLYAAAKFALEGLSESLSQEVAPHGIRVTVVEPGAFRTDFLDERSITIAANRLGAYDGTSGVVIEKLKAMSGRQLGDPALGAKAIVEAALADDPPLHLVLGSDALGRARERTSRLLAEIEANEAVSRGTDFTGERRGEGASNPLARG